MAKDPAFLFYPGDYISGTMGFTLEEKGAYIELLMMQFSRGHMTERMIGQCIGQRWDSIKEKFVQDKNGLYYNTRLEKEQIKRKAFTESRRNNKAGVNQYTKIEGHTTSRKEDIDINKDDNKDGIEITEPMLWPTFDDFWDLYDKKRGRPKSEAKWKKLDQSEKEAIMAVIPFYRKSQPDKQFRKDPIRFLNNKSWEDELIHTNGKQIDQNEVEYWLDYFNSGSNA